MQSKEQWIDEKVNELVAQISTEMEKARAVEVHPYGGYKVQCLARPLNPEIETVLKKKLEDKGWKLNAGYNDGNFVGYFFF